MRYSRTPAVVGQRPPGYTVSLPRSLFSGNPSPSWPLGPGVWVTALETEFAAGVSGWTGLRYLEEWSGIAKAFDIATGYFEIGAILALDGK